MLLPAGPVVGFQCGPALVGCGAVVVLVVLSLPDLWLISPAEYGCSGQCGRRSGCVVLPNCFRRAVSGSIMQKKKPVRLDSRAGFCAVCRLRVRLLGVVQAGKDSISFFPAGHVVRLSARAGCPGVPA